MQKLVNAGLPHIKLGRLQYYYTVDFEYNPATQRLTGFIDVDKPVTLTPFATALGAGFPCMAAGSWIRATFLTMPAGSCYGAGAIGGGLL